MARTAIQSGPKRPKETLGTKPAIESPEQLSLALLWLTWLNSVVAAAKQRFDDQLAALNQQLVKDRVVKVDEEKVDAGDYVAQLESAIVDYARNQPVFFPEGKKTWKCPLGSISSRGQQEKLHVDGDEGEWVQRFLEAKDVMPEFQRIMEEFNLAPWLRIEIKLDKAGILAAYKEKAILAEDLEKLKMAVKADPDKFTVKV